MNILVLMAGRGQRFRDKGYDKPKPLIEVNGKTILEWTTESCPYIKHGGVGQDTNIHLYFAVLQDHLDNGLGEFLYSVYGENIHIVPFDKITKGNLETAYISSHTMQFENEELLILDSDNKYSGSGIESFITMLPKDTDTTAIFVFNTNDTSLPNKWANAMVDGNIVKGIREKEDSWVTHPSLIGMFYFSTTSYFTNSAHKILNEYTPVKGEYYMSMVPTYTTKEVYAYTVTDVVPLGTPHDVQLFGRIE